MADYGMSFKHCHDILIAFLRRISGLLWMAAILLLACSCAQRGGLTLLSGGESEYVIVSPAAADSLDRLAALEFQKYFALVSGVELSIHDDHSPAAEKEIIIGVGSRVADLLPELRNLDEDGFMIRTRDHKLIIAGGAEKGTLYGVYTFLEEFLGCRKYSHEVELIPQAETIQLKSLDILREPCFDFRELHMPMARWNAHYRDWHKLDIKEGKNEWGLFVHTFDDFIPAQVFYDIHPEYFSFLNVKRVPDGQLCLSNPAVYNIVVDSLRAHMARKPEALYWSVSQNDTYKACECEPCREEYSLYGGYSGAMVHFVNRLASEFPDKVVSTLAYQYTRSAPANIKPAGNVNIMFCSIECNRSLPLWTDPSSASFRKDMEDWCRLTGNIFMWDYVVQFRNLLSPFPNLRVLQPNIQYFRDNGIKMMFQQGSGGLISEFVELRSYLIAKLLWDPDADVRGLMEDFCYGYYGPAGKHILAYIDRMHDALEQTGGSLGIYGYPYDGITTYLTPELIGEYGGIFDEAEQSVSDQPTYLDRVRVARLPLEFAIIDISLRNVNADLTLFKKEGEAWHVREDMMKRLEALTDRAIKAGVARYWEHGNYPEDYRQTIERYARSSMQDHLALGKRAELLTEASPKYPVGGASALTDGLKGINDYHFNWLGFEGPDMVAVIDLEGETEVRKVEVDFLQEIKSWVFLPQSLELYATDGDGHFYLVEKAENTIPVDREGTFTETVLLEFNPLKTKRIKVVARNMGTCPDWHPGATYPAWIFCDEIMVW
jgi:hypothetical protein